MKLVKALNTVANLANELPKLELESITDADKKVIAKYVAEVLIKGFEAGYAFAKEE